MSLQTINEKLHNVEKIPFWQFLLYAGLLPAFFAMGIVPFLNPEVEEIIYQHPLIELIFVMSFTAVVLSLVGGGLAMGIGLCWFLIKFNNGFHVKHGIVIGKSLSTNHEFLRNLAKELYQYLIKFIKAYNDPRFEELEQKHQREKKELQLQIDDLKIKLKEQNKNYENLYRFVGDKNKEMFELKTKISELESKQNEETQLLSDKIKVKNIEDEETKQI